LASDIREEATPLFRRYYAKANAFASLLNKEGRERCQEFARCQASTLRLELNEWVHLKELERILFGLAEKLGDPHSKAVEGAGFG
jgi:hypothetical protein